MATDQADVSTTHAWTPSRLAHGLGRRALRLPVLWRTRTRRRKNIWIDVGAHKGLRSLFVAARHPGMVVFAFEPDMALATALAGRLRNYIVLPLAVSETDGLVPFHVNRFSEASSVLRMDPAVLSGWIGGDQLSVIDTLMVPSIRLDTFLERANLGEIAFLKVDAQGLDLAVVRSAGSRLRSIKRIELEVPTGRPLYEGGASRQELLDYMVGKGFLLDKSSGQSHGQEENLVFQRAG